MSGEILGVTKTGDNGDIDDFMGHFNPQNSQKLHSPGPAEPRSGNVAGRASARLLVKRWGTPVVW